MPPRGALPDRAADEGEGLVSSFLFLAVWEEVWDAWPSDLSLFSWLPPPALQLAPGAVGRTGARRVLKSPTSGSRGRRRPRASPDALEHLPPGLHQNRDAFVLPFTFFPAKAEAEPHISANGSVTISFVLCLSILAAGAAWCCAT